MISKTKKKKWSLLMRNERVRDPMIQGDAVSLVKNEMKDDVRYE